MIWKLFFSYWCYEVVFVVIIVKTMFRFWPRSPSSLNQPRNKGLGPQPQCIFKFIRSGQELGYWRSTAAPYTESRLAHLVRNKCVGFPVVEHVFWIIFVLWPLSFLPGCSRNVLSCPLCPVPHLQSPPPPLASHQHTPLLANGPKKKRKYLYFCKRCSKLD